MRGQKRAYKVAHYCSKSLWWLLKSTRKIYYPGRFVIFGNDDVNSMSSYFIRSLTTTDLQCKQTLLMLFVAETQTWFPFCSSVTCVIYITLYIRYNANPQEQKLRDEWFQRALSRARMLPLSSLSCFVALFDVYVLTAAAAAAMRNLLEHREYDLESGMFI